MRRGVFTLPALLLSLAALPCAARAAEVDGAALGVWWGLPFAGMLLSMALLPLFAPQLWHHHFGKITAGWALVFLVPFALVMGPALAGAALVHTLLAEYIPFILLLTALFTATGGIYVRGQSARHAGPEHRDPGHRRRARQRDGNHRRVDVADPAADPRQ